VLTDGACLEPLRGQDAELINVPSLLKN